MIFDSIGLMGVLCVVLAYFLVTHGRFRADQPGFHVINLVGALLLLVSLYHTPNLASIVIEIIWVAISLYGLWKVYRA